MQSHKRISLSVLSLFLSLMMILFVFPADVLAGFAAEKDETEVPSVREAEESRQVDALFERTDLRRADAKYLQMSDGTVQALFYGAAVHEKDETGAWREIDNRLTEEGDTVGSAKVRFVRQVSESGELFTLRDGGRQITLSLQGAAAKTPVTVENDGREKKTFATRLEELSTLSKTVSSLRYRDLLPGTDLEYILSGNDLKENLVVRSARDGYVYSFTLALEGLCAVQDKDGSILLCDGEKTVYRMPAPYMFDDRGESSNAVSYSLREENGRGRYLLTVCADSAWINDPARAFPVTIDPTILNGGSDLSTYVREKTVNANGTIFTNDTVIRLGRYAGVDYAGVIEISAFPALPTGSVINRAQFTYTVNEVSSGTFDQLQLVLKRYTDGVTFTNATFATGVGTPIVSRSQPGIDYVSFDVTKSFHWIQNGETVVLRMSVYNNTDNKHITLYGMRAASEYPYFSVNYYDSTGLSDAFTYESFGLGNAGAAYISHNAGQLTILAGELSTFNISGEAKAFYVYNSTQAASIFDPLNYDGGHYYAMNTGIGGKLSVQQYVKRIDNTQMLYVDADGTEIILEIANEIRNDAYILAVQYASALTGFTELTTDMTSGYFAAQYPLFYQRGYSADRSAIMESKDGSVALFYNGILAAYLDDAGNLTEFTYSSHASGSGGKPLSSGNYLRTIEQYNRKSDGSNSTLSASITFFYTNQRLNCIYSGNNRIYYTYSSLTIPDAGTQSYLSEISTSVYGGANGDGSDWETETAAKYDVVVAGGIPYMQNAYDTVSGIGLTFEYYITKQKYATVQEKSFKSPQQTGAKLYLNYGFGNTTLTYGGSDLYSAADDVKTVLNFDTCGRTISSYTIDANSMILENSAVGYVGAQEASMFDRMKNLVSVSSVQGGASVNLLKEPSFEHSSLDITWKRSYASTYFQTSSERARTGNESVRIRRFSSGSYDLYLYQDVSLKPGVYTFSGYFYLESSTSVSDGPYKGAYLKIASVDNNTVTIMDSCYLSDIIDTENTGITYDEDGSAWQRVSLTFTVGSSGTYRVIAGAANVYSDVFIDDLQLERGEGAGSFSSVSLSYIHESGIENGAIASPVMDRYLQYGSEGTLVESFDEDETYIGEFYISDSAESYTISGWAMANALSSEQAEFGIRFEFCAEPQLYPYATGVIPFHSATDNWQFTSASILIPAEERPDVIRLFLAYAGNANTVYYSGLSASENQAITYAYDENGHLIGLKNRDNVQQALEFDSNGRILSSQYGNRSQTEYQYNSSNTSHRPDVVTESGITTSMTYSGSGVVLQYTVSAGSGATALNYSESSAYNDLLTKELYHINGSNLRTAYSYYNSGAVSAITVGSADNHAVDVTTHYLYNHYYDLVAAWVDSQAKVEYTYSSGLLSSLICGLDSDTQVTYTLTYDAFGNKTSVQVDNVTLAQYTYEPNTWRLKKVTYGNGFEISYTYDSAGRIRSEKRDGTTVLEYGYTQNGQIRSVTDYRDGLTYRYDYDRSGRCIGCTVWNNATHILQRSARCGYDAYGEVSWDSVYIRGIGRNSNKYAYNSTNGTITQQVSRGKNNAFFTKETLGYDALLRRTAETIVLTSSASGSGTPYLTAAKGYTYQSGTNRIEAVSYNHSPAFSYTYDDFGNITGIYKNGSFHASYEYDDLGQLIRENNVTANKTWVYTYDSRGNITGRTTYAFTATTPTASLSGALQVDTYEYFRPSYNMLWSDTLLRYNGIEYNSYDAIGNPISYYNTDFDTPYTFVWSEGRRLTSGTAGGASFAYTYGTNGLRTSKTVNGQTYDYFWDGGRLSALTISNGSGTVIATMQFGYDDLGVPVTFNYNGTLYLYQTDLQGDVTGIYNQYGLCAYYEYDAWGKILKIDSAGSAESAAINANPLRYRGYIYDAETGFYYLQSRYYDPTICRFINSDGQLNGGLLGNNLFAYCLNNPVMYSDPTGEIPEWLVISLGIAAFAAAFAVSVATFGAAAPGAACTLTAMGTSIGLGIAFASGLADVAVSTAAAFASLTMAELAFTLVVGEGLLENTLFQNNPIGYRAFMLIGVVSAVGLIALDRLSPGTCFVAGTPVAAQEGNVPIETIKAGDYVWAYDEETGKTALKQVVETYVNESDELIHLTINDEEIVTTPTHPFYVPQKGWTSAAKLRAGDVLVLLNGEYAVLEQIQHELLEKPIQVYNFQVEDYHTYYVGDTGVLVHNSCNHNREWSKERRAHWRGEGAKYANQIDPKKLSPSGTYYLNKENIDLMLKGKAPIGVDGFKVQLHHNMGILNDFYNYREITFTEHFSKFVELHPWLFGS